MVQQLLQTGADVTVCDSDQQTALHVCTPELQDKVLRWMSRPDLPLQMQLLQAAWQGDLRSVQNLLVRPPQERVAQNSVQHDSLDCDTARMFLNSTNGF